MTAAAGLVWIAGCAGASRTVEDTGDAPVGPSAILDLPRTARVDCRIVSLEPVDDGALPHSSTRRDRAVLAPRAYRVSLACRRDVGTWWTPPGTESRHRFELEAEAGRRYVVEMSNVSAGVLKWSELDDEPMIGRIVDAESGETVAEEMSDGNERRSGARD